MTNEELIYKVVYIAEHTTKLCSAIVGFSLPISSLTVFSHDDHEFQSMVEVAERIGSPYNENNGPRVALHEPVSVGVNQIRYLRIRKPDPERPQVGCNDFDVDNYNEFKSNYLSQHPKRLRLIIRQEYEMIEFSDSNYDVLAYVISR